MLTNLIQF